MIEEEMLVFSHFQSGVVVKEVTRGIAVASKEYSFKKCIEKVDQKW